LSLEAAARAASCSCLRLREAASLRSRASLSATVSSSSDSDSESESLSLSLSLSESLFSSSLPFDFLVSVLAAVFASLPVSSSSESASQLSLVTSSSLPPPLHEPCAPQPPCVGSSCVCHPWSSSSFPRQRPRPQYQRPWHQTRAFAGVGA